MLKGVKIVRERNKSYNKYGNKKVIVDGHKFDSQKEALRYKELKLMERAGVIKDLELQPTFELIPTIRTEHETLRKTVYKADFRYVDTKTDGVVVEDVKSKGTATQVYKLKKKLFLLKYGDKYTFFENFM
jgi:gp72 family protein